MAKKKGKKPQHATVTTKKLLFPGADPNDEKAWRVHVSHDGTPLPTPTQHDYVEYFLGRFSINRSELNDAAYKEFVEMVSTYILKKVVVRADAVNSFFMSIPSLYYFSPPSPTGGGSSSG